MRLEESLVIVFCAFKLVYLLTDFESWYRKSIRKRENGKHTHPRELGAQHLALSPGCSSTGHAHVQSRSKVFHEH